jgi:adenosylcobinamide-GDP ribazoletransferase
VYFPLVGLLLGALAAALDFGLQHLLPPLAGSLLVVIALLFMSGGLHLDGLADTADAFFSSRTAGRRLEIMRDSRTGPMGAAAVAVAIVLKTVLLSSVTGTMRSGVILLMPLAGRCAMLIMLSLLPYARTEGLCSVFLRNRSPFQAFWAAFFLLLTGFLALGMAGLFSGVSACAAALLLAGYTRRKIGGMTGDTIGAASEIAELVPPLAVAVWIFRGGIA